MFPLFALAAPVVSAAAVESFGAGATLGISLFKTAKGK